MKILFMTYYHAFQNPGGGEVVLIKTFEHLKNNGIHVELFDPWKTKISHFDLVHNFATLNYRQWDGVKTYGPKLALTPVMWTDDSVISCTKEKLKANIKNLLGLRSSEVNFWNALHNIDYFFPTTNLESHRIQKRFNLASSKFATIYNGVEVPDNLQTKTSFCEKNNLYDYFLFVGRISPLKNVHLIIDAVKKIDQKIVIVGESDSVDSSYFQKLKEKYKDDSKVIFIGSLKSESDELNDVYLNSKGLIVASEFETCSLVGLEAGVRGVPVYMTTRGATSEVYQDKVTYLSPDNSDAIASRITIKWQDNEKLLLKKFITDHYSWEKTSQKLALKYSEILKN